MSAPTRCLTLAIAGLVVGAAIGSVACGGGAGSSGAGGPALIEVETSPPFMTVTNRAGGALVDVHVSIVPVGEATLFSVTIPRMESGEKHNLSFGEFRGRDGTPYDARTVRAKAVRVSGKDLNGKTVEAEKPWR